MARVAGIAGRRNRRRSSRELRELRERNRRRSKSRIRILPEEETEEKEEEEEVAANYAKETKEEASLDNDMETPSGESMQQTNPDLLFPSESYRIKRACLAVHSELGCGFLEKVYENAAGHELRKAGFSVRQQVAVEVPYDGIVVGNYVIDMLVDEKFILEVKACEAENPVHKAQVINYLKATGHELGFLVNFGKVSLDFKRVVFTKHK